MFFCNFNGERNLVIGSGHPNTNITAKLGDRVLDELTETMDSMNIVLSGTTSPLKEDQRSFTPEGESKSGIVNWDTSFYTSFRRGRNRRRPLE